MLDGIYKVVKKLDRHLEMHEGTCRDVEWEVKGHLHDTRLEAEKFLQGFAVMLETHRTAVHADVERCILVTLTSRDMVLDAVRNL